jgi:hypothetical protein
VNLVAITKFISKLTDNYMKGEKIGYDNSKDVRSVDSSYQLRLEEMISVVDIHEKDGEVEKPSISFSDFGVREFRNLESSLDGEGGEQMNIFAVVRCWNKSEQDLVDFLKKVQNIRKSIPHLKGVFISVNSDGEKDNLTESNLEKAMKAVTLGIPVVPIGVKNYSWTAGLNAPVAMLNEVCLGKQIDLEKVRVMNMSFGVEISDEDLKKCNKELSDGRYILTARMTADASSPFAQRGSGQELWNKFKSIMRNPNEADLAELAYTMRNTMNIIPLADIVRLGGFNPVCNGKTRHFEGGEREVTIQGMEDAELFMRLILSALRSGDMYILKNLRRSMDNPIFYNDIDWNRMHEVGKIRKIGNEMKALALIMSGKAGKDSVPNVNGGREVVSLDGDMHIPESRQDFRLRIRE